MLLWNDKSQLSLDLGAQQVPNGMLELHTPTSATFLPSLDALLPDDNVPSPSNCFDLASYNDSMDYFSLDNPEEAVFYLPNPENKFNFSSSIKSSSNNSTNSSVSNSQNNFNIMTCNDDYASDRLVSLLASMAESLPQHQPQQGASKLLEGGAALAEERAHTPAPYYPMDNGGEFVGQIRVKCEPITSSSPHDNTCRVSTQEINSLPEQVVMVEQLLADDVKITCDTLGISPDPPQWSREDVQKWILYTLRQRDLPMVPPFNNLDMDGSLLCSLPDGYLRQLHPHVGYHLSTELELFKSISASGYFHRQKLSSPAVFQPEDSLLDISCLQVPQQQYNLHPHSPLNMNRDDSCSPSPNSMASSDMLSQALLSDYSSNGEFNSDDDLSEDGMEGSTDKSAVMGDNKGVTLPTRQGSHSHIHLWQFLKELLTHGQTYGSCIRWLDRSKGVFKIEDSVRVAKLWGKRKNRPAMNYDKLSRSIRQYYKKGIMKKTERSQRLVYQFCHPYCL